MRYIFYHYNQYGTLVFDYYDDETHVTQIVCILFTQTGCKQIQTRQRLAV